MSVRLTHDVFCDECGDWTFALVAGHATLKRARAHAKRGGWAYVHTPEGYKDLCPRCAEKREKEK